MIDSLQVFIKLKMANLPVNTLVGVVNSKDQQGFPIFKDTKIHVKPDFSGQTINPKYQITKVIKFKDM